METSYSTNMINMARHLTNSSTLRCYMNYLSRVTKGSGVLQFSLVCRIHVWIDLQAWCRKSVYAISTYQQERSLVQRDYKSLRLCFGLLV